MGFDYDISGPEFIYSNVKFSTDEETCVSKFKMQGLSPTER